MISLLLSLLLSPLAHAAYPSFEQVRASHISSEAWLLDRHGQLLQSLRVDKTRRRLPWVSLPDLSPAMIDALIASEDKRFLSHSGVDWQAMVGAIWTNLAERRQRGASTLTMQLVGLLDPKLRRDADGRTISQKWQQIGAARDLEKRWSKQQIIEAYLNLANFRGELAGIAAASKGLFGKHPSGLDKSEASLLAALLRGPNAKPKLVAKRACGVAHQTGLKDCKRIDSLAWSALAARPRIELEGQLAPHLARHIDRQAPLKPGQSLRVSLDADLQTLVLDTLRQHLVELQDRQVEDGAVLVLDNATGEVLAWVGSSAATSQAAEVDGVTALRLPGSTLKPLLYGLAIDRRLLTAASPLEDSPLVLDTPLGQYVPQNYERDFKGWVSVRNALGASLNVPAVRTLLLVGIDRFLAELRLMGLTSLERDSEFYGYSLALGGGEVTLQELTNAYRSLANGGVLKPMHWLPTEVTSPRRRPGSSTPLDSGLRRNDGKSLQSAPPSQRVLTRETAYIISDILADKAARALTFGLSSPLETLGWAAVKTGTSKDMRDNWCLGFNDRYTVGVWVGNASGTPMRDVSGVTGAAPIWQAIMNKLQAGQPAKPPKPPAGIEARSVQFEPPIEPHRRELFLAGTAQDRIVLPPTNPLGTRIEGPGHGAILARDPDIPAEHHKVRFRANGDMNNLRWYIDDQPADPAWLDHDGNLLWPLQPGAHRISLRDAAGGVVDAMWVTVK